MSEHEKSGQDKDYVWKGPATLVEVWTEPPEGGDAKPELVFSGQIAPGRPIGAPLPSDNSQVRGWLAFKLIEEVAAGQASSGQARSEQIKLEAASPDRPARQARSKEAIDG